MEALIVVACHLEALSADRPFAGTNVFGVSTPTRSIDNHLKTHMTRKKTMSDTGV